MSFDPVCFNEMYRVYADHVKRDGISFEDVDIVVSLALKEDDVLLRYVAKRLGTLVLSGDGLQVFPWLERYLEEHPWLKHRVHESIRDEKDPVEDKE
jgi:hypothetical protein